MAPVQGRVWVVGDNISTGEIYPERFLELVEPEDIARHALEGVDPSFPARIRPGDIIVAGRNFGCGSSREHAATALKYGGVAAVVAESFGRIFFRNAINLGLPLVICAGVAGAVKDGDEIRVNPSEGTVERLSDGKVFRGEPLSGYVLEILGAGGIRELFRRRQQAVGA